MAPEQGRRMFPRVRAVKPCRLSWEDREVPGQTKNVSYRGVAAMLLSDVEWREQAARLVVLPEEIILLVHPVWHDRTEEGTTMGFRVERVERGEPEWEQLAYRPQW